MNSYQSLSQESEIPENEQPLNYAEGKRSKTYATETSSPPIRVEPVEEQKSKSLSAMRQHASKQIDQLQKQADLLVKQARQIESRVELAEKIGKARFGFKPVLLQHYFLYRKNIDTASEEMNEKVVGEDLTLSLVGPEEWNDLCPYGMLIAKVRQLGDSTWEVVENDGC